MHHKLKNLHLRYLWVQNHCLWQFPDQLAWYKIVPGYVVYFVNGKSLQCQLHMTYNAKFLSISRNLFIKFYIGMYVLTFNLKVLRKTS